MNRGARGSIASTTYVIGWLVLLLLTAASLISAYLHLGVFGPIVEFGIAATEAAIVFMLFMRLRTQSPLN
jgi:caa(3)-type oxidase subunit IV